MLGFSAVFAAPFFLLALFPSFMQKLPKAGGWMNNVKVVMGFLEIAAAIKFISNVDLVWSLGIMPREMFLAIWIGCAVLITLYVLGTFRLPHDSEVNGVSSPRLIFAILFSTITIYLWSGLYGKSLGELDAFLPPPDYEQLMSSSAGSIQSTGPVNSNPSGSTAVKPSGEENSEWLTDYKQALKIAKETNKSLFIDFTGFTCTNCRWMETKMFVKTEIDKLIGQYVKVRLYTDRQQEPYISNKMLQMEKFNSIELPLYVILRPDGELVGTKAFTRDEKEFLTFLQSGLKM
jgi:thiol:disulfide interchange protein DsbD